VEVKGLPDDQKAKVESIITMAKKAGRANLVETEAREILRLYGLPVSYFRLVTNEEDAVQAATRIRYPVAMKIVSPDIIHKSEAGGVMLDVRNEDNVLKAFNEIVSSAKVYDENAEIHSYRRLKRPR